MTKLDLEFEDDWNCESENIRFFAEKDRAKSWWLRGRLAGIEAQIRKVKGEMNPISPDEALKVEAATVGEHTNYSLLGQVIEAKKHSN